MTCSTLARWIFLSALCVAVAGVAPKIPCPADPFKSPSTDNCNPLRYIANNVLTGIAVGLFIAAGLIQAWLMKKWGAKWMLAMTIGMFTFATGLATRFGLHSDPQSKGTYIAQYLFVVLSPCAFIAADYVLLGRLAQHLGMGQHLAISPKRITIVFLLSDLTTFLIQALGGALSLSANDLKMGKTGSNVFLAGLCIQLASFLTFTVVYLLFLTRVRSQHPDVWSRDAGGKKLNDWRALALALFVSCIGILIRSLFRVIELSEGFQGPIASNEGMFYGLDTLPLFVATVVYTVCWPGRFVPPMPTVEDTVLEEKKPESVELQG